jgi:hypothetical protein
MVCQSCLTWYLAIVLKAIQYLLQSPFPCTSQGNRSPRWTWPLP